MSSEQVPVASVPRVRPIVDALVAQLTAHLQATVVIEHPGENGRAREQVLKAFLAEVVPEDFAVTSGFVIDCDGHISRQVDLLIYRRGYHPVFRVGEIPLLLVESVAAAIEVKAAIDSVEDLTTAIGNLESVRALDRTNHGQNYALRGSERGIQVSHNHAHEIFTAIVTERSLGIENLAQRLLEYMRTHSRRFWPNAYVDIHRLHVAFAETVASDTATNWDYDNARALSITDAADPRFIAPLIEFVGSLLDFLRITPLIDYLPSSYLPLRGGRVRTWPLDDPEMPAYPAATTTEP